MLNSDTVVTKGFLEEMIEVLYLSDRHGAVFPRSNNATIASIPVNGVYKRKEIDYGYDVYQKIKAFLPRYTVTPTGVGFCLLIKRSMIKNFGLFDPIYGLGYQEENDFCQRINKYGYSIAMCNQAFVYHLESRSFSKKQKNQLNKKNEKTLYSRYPYYPYLVHRYFKKEIHPVDHFADLIAKPEKIKILINLFHFPLAFNGTTRAGLSLLNFIKKNDIKNKYEFTILAQSDAIKFHNLKKYGFKLVTPQNIGDKQFHIGYCPNQIFHVENLFLMNRHCYKNVFSLLDIITLRCNYLLSNNYSLSTIFYDSLNIADRVVSISEFSKNDTVAYFNNTSLDFSKIIPIRMGYAKPLFSDNGVAISISDRVQKVLNSSNYILVFGNDFKHKAIDKVLEVAKKDISNNYIIIGPHGKSNHGKNINILPSGGLSDKSINQLIINSKILLFPSQYEGFGFPIMDSAKYGVPLVYFDGEVGNEIVGMTKFKNAFPFKIFSELQSVIDLASDTSSMRIEVNNLRSLDDYNRDVMELVEKELSDLTPNIKLLEARWSYIGRMSDYFSTAPSIKYPIKIRALKSLQKKSPIIYSILRSYYRKINN